MEHESNFRDMIEYLMTEDTLERVANSAAALVLTFNHKIEWVPSDYNLDEIQPALANFIENLKQDKMFLCRFAKVYFRAFIAQKDSFDPNVMAQRNKQNPSLSAELVNIKNVFLNSKFDDAELHPYAVKLLGDTYDKTACKNYFYPTMLLFLLRFLDVYDQSLEGKTVEEYITKNQQPETPKNKREELIKQMGDQILQSFGLADFWQARYSTLTESITYDWYIDSSETIKLLYQHIPLLKASKQKNSESSLRILYEGCGNSTLLEDLYDEGFHNLAGIDFSEKAVEVMLTRRDRQKKSTIIYDCMDVRGLRFDNGKFDVVIDKGCIDCLIFTPNDKATSKQYLHLALSEASRVLKVGGYYILLSCGINEDAFSKFEVDKKFGWKVLHTSRVEGKTGLNFDVNLIVCKKEH
eukprot:TRINITY_DN1071_c0_g1_i3.p2 TRINITY_DN1071_c0_g1~~TRINITY_DN1071_c0_g1_i3.p2  ORF type:complete len:410 (+),score=81.13 TRINITY_DN1071_c0_g1_i3:2703-3932(+)